MFRTLAFFGAGTGIEIVREQNVGEGVWNCVGGTYLSNIESVYKALTRNTRKELTIEEQTWLNDKILPGDRWWAGKSDVFSHGPDCKDLNCTGCVDITDQKIGDELREEHLLYAPIANIDSRAPLERVDEERASADYGVNEEGYEHQPLGDLPPTTEAPRLVSDMIPPSKPDLATTDICEVCKTPISNLGTHAMTMSGECPITAQLLREMIDRHTHANAAYYADYELQAAAEFLNRRLIRRG